MKQKISEKKKRPKQCRARVADMERSGQTGSRAKSVVRAIDIGKAIGNEDGRKDVDPSLPHLSLNPGTALSALRQFRFGKRLSGARH